MNKEQLDKMTAFEKRLAIAELCGWSVRREGYGGFCFHSPRGTMCGTYYRPEFPECWDAPEGVPDYLNSLDAMAEAEKVVTYYPDYLFHLREITGPFPDSQCEWDDHWWQSVVRATASQRADAFLLTMLP